MQDRIAIHGIFLSIVFALYIGFRIGIEYKSFLYGLSAYWWTALVGTLITVVTIFVLQPIFNSIGKDKRP